jgi:predicted nuclease of predicted toxin-antitoxin system
MRLYLDQMFRLDLAAILRSQEHDVLCASEAGQQTADDSEILRMAIEEDRTLITMDEHFGDWAILPLARHPGVLRVKTHPSTTSNIARMLCPFLAAHSQDELRDHLIILSPRSERWIETRQD